MKIIKALFLSLVCAVLFTSCATVEITSPNSLDGIEIAGAETAPDRVVYLSNSGCHLFWTLTLASGDIRWDDLKDDINGGALFFEDVATTNQLLYVLGEVARRENCDVANLILSDSTDSNLSLTSYQGGIAGLFGTSTVKLSTILRKK